MVKPLVSIIISLVFLVSQLGLASGVALEDGTQSICQHCDCGGSSCCMGDSFPQRDFPPVVPWSGEKFEDHQQFQSWTSIRPLSLETVSNAKSSSLDWGRYRSSNVPIFLFVSSFLI
jgi:hypothetical protein